MTEQFKMRPDGFNEVRKLILIKAIPVSLLAAFGGLAISHFNTNSQHSDVNVYPFLIPMVLGSLAFGFYLAITRQKKIYESYRLTLDHNGITREQYNTPIITILKNEITEIVKNSDRSFTIKGNSKLNQIGVPSQVDDYEKLEQLLGDIKPITTKTREPFFQKFSALISILVVGLMAAVYISKDKIIVGVSGSVLLVVLVYSFITGQRSKNIDNRTKKMLWVVILVAVSIIGIMYSKFKI